MLTVTYTWGTAPDNLVFTKLYDDANTSHFAVSGLAPAEAKTMVVGYQQTKGGVTRTMLDFSEVRALPGSTNGTTYTDRVYLVVVRSPHTSEALIMSQIARASAAASNVPFMTALMGGQR